MITTNDVNLTLTLTKVSDRIIEPHVNNDLIQLKGKILDPSLKIKLDQKYNLWYCPITMLYFLLTLDNEFKFWTNTSSKYWKKIEVK